MGYETVAIAKTANKATASGEPLVSVATLQCIWSSLGRRERPAGSTVATLGFAEDVYCTVKDGSPCC